MSTILMIDDDESTLLAYDTILRMQGHQDIIACSNSLDALRFAETRHPQVVLLDLTMPQRSGVEVLADLTSRFPAIPVVVVTGSDDIDTAVRCIKLGAHDFLVKPVTRERLETTVAQVLRISDLVSENVRLQGRLLREGLDRPEVFENIVTQNEQMLALFQYVETVAPSPYPVLITGETGVGKELFARALHDASGRKGGYVPVNVAGLDDAVISDTLYGHVKGAFTGADASRKGLVEEAAGGTLFLDEIGDLSQASQVKLLRLLEQGEYLTLGNDKPRHTTARIVVATNKDPQALRAGTGFRQDLYFRLASHQIHVPPLRERMDDLPLLIHHFLDSAAQAMNRPRAALHPGVVPGLYGHAFPGNLRELRAMAINAVSRHAKGPLTLAEFQGGMESAGSTVEGGSPGDKKAPIQFNGPLPTIHQVKALVIEEALRRTGGNKSAAAEMIGITRQAINWRSRQ